MNNLPKKPFGLSLACKIAAQAIKEEVAPVSTIITNLLLLQKSNSFPTDLSTDFFSANKSPTENEKRVIGGILNELRRPLNSIPDMLETFIKNEWAIKKAPIKTPDFKKSSPKNTTPKIKAKKAIINKKPKVDTTIIIKKNKLS